MNKLSRLPARVVLLTLLVGGLGVLAAGFALLPAKALHTVAYVDGNVKWQQPTDGTAKPTVVGWENECTQTFNDNRSSMAHSTEEQQRAVVNASAYNQSIWITRRNDPRDINNPPVLAGTPVNMQINEIMFLCAIITMNASGFQIANDHKVTNTNYVNDRAPVPDSGAAAYKVNQASRYESNSYIYSVRLVGGPGGTLTNNPTGSVLGYVRDNNSRYWRASPIPFTYTPPGNLAAGTYTITVEMEYATIQTYHAYGSAGTSRCVLRTTGDGADVPYGAYSRCERNTRNFSFRLTVQASTKLKAGMSVTPRHIFENDVASFTPSITVTNYSGTSIAARCTINRTLRSPSGAVSSLGAQPCVDNTGNPNITLSGNGVFNLRPNSYTATSAATPGSQICDTITITQPTGSNYYAAAADNTATDCVIIAKTPYVHFMNNDVWAGGGFASVSPACNTSAKITTSSQSLQDGTNAGSATEYGAFALGKITNFGSASKALVNPAAAVGKMLTFSNTNSANLGFFGAPQHCITDYVSDYSGTPITAEPATIDVNARPSGTWQVNGARTFHGMMPVGSKQVYLVNGDVTIDANLTYPANYGTTPDGIPSLVIIATGNILVRNNVGQMDGLFVTRGAFNTCSNAPAGNLSISTCNQQLVVNGSVVASTLTLLRTYGADGNNDTDRKRPAEVFNFSPEMYLRSALPGSGANKVKTIDEKDLPPRY